MESEPPASRPASHFGHLYALNGHKIDLKLSRSEIKSFGVLRRTDLRQPHVEEPSNIQNQDMKIMTPKIAGLVSALLASTPVWGAVISVNYDVTVTSTPALAPTDIAGAVPAANWNNLQALGYSEPFNYGITYVDDSGAATTLTVAASSGGGDSWNTGGTPDEIIFGDKSNWAGGTQTLTLGNVPYATYDLYIYSSEWGSEVVNFTIGTDTQTLTNTFTPQFTGGPNLVQNDTYVKFTGLSGDVTVSMNVTSGGLHLGGFQIVQVPEPSILGLLAFAPVLAFRRRRD